MQTSLHPASAPESWAEQFAASLCAQRDRVREFLAAQEARLQQAETQLEKELQRPACQAEVCVAPNDFQRRYDLALDDLCELKAKNAELQQQVARLRAAAETARRSGGRLDWEAEKERLLAALESDFADANDDRQAERLKIKGVVRTTDQMIAEKDREIADLKQLLDERNRKLGAPPAIAAAVSEEVDKDAVLCRERAALQQLQDDWREKLRQAEIELSLERAKIARQHAELNEKRRELEKQIADLPAAASPSSGAANLSTKPPRGQWLARLGLTEEHVERGK